MQRAVFWVLLAGQVIVAACGFVLIYRNHRRHGRGDHGTALSSLAAALVFLMTATQFYRVAEDPARAGGWIVLGIGIASSALVTFGLLRRRHAAPSGGKAD